MKAKLISIMGGIAFAAVVPGAAYAGGDYYGGAIQGAAVPAPIPAPVYEPVWYFRIDGGVGMGDAATASESGMVFGETSDQDIYSADHTFGSSKSWLKSEYDHYAVIGGGIGYRFSDRFRIDGTIDYHRGAKVEIEGSDNAGLVAAGSAAPGSFEGKVLDVTDTQGAVFMLNAYMDLGRWGSWTPYVGGGVGVASTFIERRVYVKETAHEELGSDTVEHKRDSISATGDETVHTIAAMATAGATYKLTDITDLDLNYRYMFIDGVNTDVEVNGHTSTVTIGDTHDHQLRAGLRFNVN